MDLFYKDISNYILNATNPEQWTDYSLAGPPDGDLRDHAALQRRSRDIGGRRRSRIQQTFAYGFGVQANYTIMHTTSASGPLPFSSKNQVYLSPFYENKWGLVRLTYSWRDDYESSSFNGQSAVWTAPYTELDANATINITKNFSILLAATNLLDETYHQYFKNIGAGSVLADEYKFGREYSVGAPLELLGLALGLDSA